MIFLLCADLFFFSNSFRNISLYQGQIQQIVESDLGSNCFQSYQQTTQAGKNLSNSYTMGCPPVRGDNPRALASGLSYVQLDKHGITILYHLHQCRPCTSSDIPC